MLAPASTSRMMISSFSALAAYAIAAPSLGSAEAAVSNRQNYKEGEQVPKGTVIKVNFVYTDTRDG